MEGPDDVCHPSIKMSIMMVVSEASPATKSEMHSSPLSTRRWTSPNSMSVRSFISKMEHEHGPRMIISSYRSSRA